MRGFHNSVMVIIFQLQGAILEIPLYLGLFKEICSQQKILFSRFYYLELHRNKQVLYGYSYIFNYSQSSLSSTISGNYSNFGGFGNFKIKESSQFICDYAYCCTGV